MARDVLRHARRQQLPGHLAPGKLRAQDGGGDRDRRHAEQDDIAGRRVRQCVATPFRQKAFNRRRQPPQRDAFALRGGDVREVTAGLECGVGLEGFNDLKERDVIECFEIEEVSASL